MDSVDKISTFNSADWPSIEGLMSAVNMDRSRTPAGTVAGRGIEVLDRLSRPPAAVNRGDNPGSRDRAVVVIMQRVSDGLSAANRLRVDIQRQGHIRRAVQVCIQAPRWARSDLQIMLQKDRRHTCRFGGQFKVQVAICELPGGRANTGCAGIGPFIMLGQGKRQIEGVQTPPD